MKKVFKVHIEEVAPFVGFQLCRFYGQVYHKKKEPLAKANGSSILRIEKLSVVLFLILSSVVSSSLISLLVFLCSFWLRKKSFVRKFELT